MTSSLFKKFIFLSLLFCTFSIYKLDAQSDNLFKAGGYTVGVFSATDVEYFDAGFGYGFRYSLANLSDNASVGFTGTPTISLISGGGGSGLSFKIPLELSLDLGAGSTYDSDKDFGFFVGAGMTPILAPFVTFDGLNNVDKFSISPTFKIGIRRFKSKDNALHEFTVRYVNLPNVGNGDNATYGISLQWFKVLNY